MCLSTATRSSWVVAGTAHKLNLLRRVYAAAVATSLRADNPGRCPHQRVRVRCGLATSDRPFSLRVASSQEALHL